MTNAVLNNNLLKRLLVSHTIFYGARIAFAIFLNVFLWKQTNDVNLIVWFNITYLFIHSCSFHFFAYLVKKGNIHLPRKLGLMGMIVTYLFVAILGDKIIEYVYLVAFLIGIFNGLYWISYHIIRFDLTSRTNRGNYSGLEFGLNIAIGIIMPVLSGAIISWDFLGYGYPMLFSFAAFMFLVALIIGNVKFKVHNGEDVHFYKTFKLILKDSDMRKSMISQTFGNISRGGTIANFLLPLFIFEVLKNEFGLGSILSTFSIAAIFFSFSFGKFVDYKHYKNIVLIGGIFYSLLILLIAFKYSFWLILLFGILIKFFDVLLKIPKRVIAENLIHNFKDFEKHRIEYIVIKEWFIVGIGRVFGLFLFLGVKDLVMDQMQLAMVFIAVFTMLDVFTVRSIKANV